MCGGGGNEGTRNVSRVCQVSRKSEVRMGIEGARTPPRTFCLYERRGMKFRVWDEILNELDYSPLWSITTDGTIYYGDDEYPRAKIELFTGLLDKNGKEIYEGDITISDWGYSGIVDFDNFIYAECESTISDNIEVIGNIHEKGDL